MGTDPTSVAGSDLISRDHQSAPDAGVLPMGNIVEGRVAIVTAGMHRARRFAGVL